MEIVSNEKVLLPLLVVLHLSKKKGLALFRNCLLSVILFMFRVSFMFRLSRACEGYHGSASIMLIFVEKSGACLTT